MALRNRGKNWIYWVDRYREQRELFGSLSVLGKLKCERGKPLNPFPRTSARGTWVPSFSQDPAPSSTPTSTPFLKLQRRCYLGRLSQSELRKCSPGMGTNKELSRVCWGGGAPLEERDLRTLELRLRGESKDPVQGGRIHLPTDTPPLPKCIQSP